MATPLQLKEKGPTMKSQGFSMTPELIAEIDDRAKRLNVSKSALVSAIVKNYFDDNPMQKKRAGKR